MFLKSLQVALLLSSAVLLAASPPDAAARERAGEREARELATSHVSPRLIVTMSVSRAGNEATYGVSLRNPGNAEVRDIFLAATIAGDTTFVGPGPNPARSGFKGVEGNAVVWLSETVSAYSALGPFTYRVRLAGDTAEPVRAWVHWLRPGDGTGISGPIRVLPGFSVGPLATGSAERLPQGPLMWRVVEVNRLAQDDAGLGMPTTNPRLIYILEGTRQFGQDGVTGTYGPGSAHFIKPFVPFTDANRTDAPERRFVFEPTPSSGRGQPGRGGGVNVAYQSEDLVGLREGAYDMILFRAEWQPGASSPLHQYPGPVMVHLLEGTVAHTDEGVTRTINAGEFWGTQVGAKVTTKNTGNTKAVAIIARLIPKGEAPATFLEPPNPLSFR